MVQSKAILFDKDLQEKALFFKALSHPARIWILKYLAEKRVCITRDISKEIPISRTTINQHLNELKNAGLISGEIKGAKTKYCVNLKNFQVMATMSDGFFQSFDFKFKNNCE